MTAPSPTVATSFAQSMLAGATTMLGPDHVRGLLRDSGIDEPLFRKPGARISREQFVRLYETVALATGDEMLGLWSRPIRGGTLKYLGQSLLDAPTVFTAMYRFTRFWNLLLDDYQLGFQSDRGIVTFALSPRSPDVTPIVFGHELMIKLIHGMASWLADRDLQIVSLGFGFPRPEHFSEYAQLFPGPVTFDHNVTFVSFEERSLLQRFHRSKSELLTFVKRAPDDWIFVTFDHGGTASRVRAFLSNTPAPEQNFAVASACVHMSERTLSRRLASEGTSFQRIRDEVRRDMAVYELINTSSPIESIAAKVGFDNTPAFYRAFRNWTGSTPAAFRRSSNRA